MKRILCAAACAAVVTGEALADQGTGKASLDAQRANEHYTRGWSAIHSESWDAAVREFEAAIESDERFALAYYSLGRAHMGRRDFPAAITAYLKCRDLYQNAGGEQFSSQMQARQRINDRLLEYRTALNQATSQTSAAKSNTQSQSLYVRELQNQIRLLEQARDRTENVTLNIPVPYFVPMSLGAAYFRSGRVEDAEREYKAALAANAASGETHNNLAVLYLTTRRYQEADAALKAAEKVGFRVNENLKGDIRKALRESGR